VNNVGSLLYSLFNPSTFTMKFSVKCLIAAIAVSQTSAFHTPQNFGRHTKLSVTTLEEWQLLDNGSVVGSVKDHPSLNDGDVITTSPLANPSAAGVSATVSTMTGSEYMLGSPMQGKRTLPVEQGTVDRATIFKTLGVSGLVAGGFALGLVAGGGGGAQSSAIMTVPEVRIGG
jgi:hypothetical protein